MCDAAVASRSPTSKDPKPTRKKKHEAPVTAKDTDGKQVMDPSTGQETYESSNADDASSSSTARKQLKLSRPQVRKLKTVLQDLYEIHGPLDGNVQTWPVICVEPATLIRELRKRLSKQAHGVTVRHVAINGGAASFVIGRHIRMKKFNDLDLLFSVDFPYEQRSMKFNMIRDIVLRTLIEFLPPNVDRMNYNAAMIGRIYCEKMFKFSDMDSGFHRDTNGDCWSLISFRNDFGRNLEFKFVHSMKRQFEFSTDSFQIILTDEVLETGPAQVPMPPPLVIPAMPSGMILPMHPSQASEDPLYNITHMSRSLPPQMYGTGHGQWTVVDQPPIPGLFMPLPPSVSVESTPAPPSVPSSGAGVTASMGTWSPGSGPSVASGCEQHRMTPSFECMPNLDTDKPVDICGSDTNGATSGSSCGPQNGGDYTMTETEATDNAASNRELLRSESIECEGKTSLDNNAHTESESSESASPAPSPAFQSLNNAFSVSGEHKTTTSSVGPSPVKNAAECPTAPAPLSGEMLLVMDLLQMPSSPAIAVEGGKFGEVIAHEVLQELIQEIIILENGANAAEIQDCGHLVVENDELAENIPSKNGERLHNVISNAKNECISKDDDRLVKTIPNETGEQPEKIPSQIDGGAVKRDRDGNVLQDEVVQPDKGNEVQTDTAEANVPEPFALEETATAQSIACGEAATSPTTGAAVNQATTATKGTDTGRSDALRSDGEGGSEPEVRPPPRPASPGWVEVQPKKKKKRKRKRRKDDLPPLPLMKPSVQTKVRSWADWVYDDDEDMFAMSPGLLRISPCPSGSRKASLKANNTFLTGKQTQPTKLRASVEAWTPNRPRPGEKRRAERELTTPVRSMPTLLPPTPDCVTSGTKKRRLSPKSKKKSWVPNINVAEFVPGSSSALGGVVNAGVSYADVARSPQCPSSQYSKFIIPGLHPFVPPNLHGQAGCPNAKEFRERRANDCSEYPTVIAKSMYKNFGEALRHLDNKLISIWCPELIRGGGLLRYCDLLYQGFGHEANFTERDILKLELDMVVRFFIDFVDNVSQRKTIGSYLSCHYMNLMQEATGYLETVQKVIQRSSANGKRDAVILLDDLIEENNHGEGS